MASYNYVLADFTITSDPDLNLLTTEIAASAITVSLDFITRDGNDFTLEFASNLSGGEVTTLDGLVAAHNPPAEIPANIIKNKDGTITLEGSLIYTTGVFDGCPKVEVFTIDPVIVSTTAVTRVFITMMNFDSLTEAIVNGVSYPITVVDRTRGYFDHPAGLTVGTYDLTLRRGTRDTVMSNALGAQDLFNNLVDWIDHTPSAANFTYTSGVIQRDSGSSWDHGALSDKSIQTDGYYSFQATSSGAAMMGLNSVDSNGSYTDIEYAIYLTGNQWYIYENGAFAGANGTHSGDSSIFKVDRTGTTVTYYVDTVLVYTSTVTTSATLFLDCSLNSAGKQFTNVRLVAPTASVVNT